MDPNNIPWWPGAAVTADNSDTKSFETDSVVLTLQTRVTQQQIHDLSMTNPDIDAAIKALFNQGGN